MTLDKYAPIFDIFADTEAKITDVSDYDDYTGTGSEVEICTVTGDLQPYSGELAAEEYGLNLECEKKLFCKSLPSEVCEGMKTAADGIRYIIKYIERGRMGVMLLLKREAVQS